jgi:hypothetical protein
MINPEFVSSCAIPCRGFLVVSIFLSMSDTLIKLWCWLGVKSNHRINHWMNLFYSFWEKLSVLPRGPVCQESLCSITIGRNYCDLFLCPTFLWLSLKVSISWNCSNSPSFSQILSQQYVWTLRGTKRYRLLSSPLCPITPTVCHIFFPDRISFHLKVTVSYCYLHTNQLTISPTRYWCKLVIFSYF